MILAILLFLLIIGLATCCAFTINVLIVAVGLFMLGEVNSFKEGINETLTGMEESEKGFVWVVFAMPICVLLTVIWLIFMFYRFIILLPTKIITRLFRKMC